MPRTSSPSRISFRPLIQVMIWPVWGEYIDVTRIVSGDHVLNQNVAGLVFHINGLNMWYVFMLCKDYEFFHVKGA